MIIVISPAKTLDFTSKIPACTSTLSDFLSDSSKLVNILRKKTSGELSNLMGISQKLAELNVQRFADYKTNFTSENSRPAIFAFKGDVYQGIQVEKYKKTDLDFAQEHLRILSGLYGLLRPLDLIQPYRLEMGTELKNPDGKNLYEFWGDKITKKINSELQAQKSNILINLASNEYFKAINEKSLNGKIVNIMFKEKQGKDYKIIGLFAKKARGMMASFIVKNRITNTDNLSEFKEGGYRFNDNLSDNKNYVFTRNKA